MSGTGLSETGLNRNGIIGLTTAGRPPKPQGNLAKGATVIFQAPAGADDHPVEWLREVYHRRKRQNPRYSLRAFAKSLNLNSGRMSEILSYKRPLTPSMGARIAAKLKLEPMQAEKFHALIANQRQHSQDIRSMDRRAGGRSHVKILNLDQFRLIADWQHFAILALMRTKSFTTDMDWIARRLGISLKSATQAINRLTRLGLMSRTAGAWEPTERKLATPRDIASQAVRKAHRQNMLKALGALGSVPVAQRDFSSITMAIAAEQLPLAKEYIQEFRRRMATLLETKDADAVYTLNIQLFPLTQEDSP